MNFQTFRNILFIGSIGLTLASTVGVVAGEGNLKNFGFGGIGAGLSTLVTLELLSGSLNKQSKELTKQNLEEIKVKNNQIKELKLSVQSLESKLSVAKSEFDESQKGLNQAIIAFKSSESKLKTKEQELQDSQYEIHKLQLNIQNIGNFNASESHRIVRDTYNRQVKKVECLLNALIRNYPDYREDFESILDEFESYRVKFLNRIEEYESVNNFEDLLDTGLDIQERIIDQSVELRCKAQALLIKDFRKILDNAIDGDEVEEIVNSLTSQAQSTIESLKENWDKDKQAIVSEWVMSNEQMVERYQTEFSTNLNIAKEAVNKIDELESQLLQVKQQLIEAQKPQTFYGHTLPALAGNRIIEWYYSNKGYSLDAITWTETTTGYEVIFGIRKNPALSNDDLLADNGKERIAAFCNCYPGTSPKLQFNRQDNTVTLTIQLRPEIKIELTPHEKANKLRHELAGTDALLDFVNGNPHIGLWGSTGDGKTVAISNLIGGMAKSLGGQAKMKVCVPKIDEDTQTSFPHIDWLGINESVYALLDCALEIQYRNHLNQEKYLKGIAIQPYEPIIYFIDEINALMTRWGSINDKDVSSVLEKFRISISDFEKLKYFDEYMVEELINYKGTFAKKLLTFIWQFGRSLKVKTLIGGQNLQPSVFSMKINDIANCAYIALNSGKSRCIHYKVENVFSSEIENVKDEIDKAILVDSNLKYTGLCCPNSGKPFFVILPPPNYYKWEVSNNGLINSLELDDRDEELNYLEARNTTSTELAGLPNSWMKLDGELDDSSNEYPSAPSLQTLSVRSFSDWMELPNWLKSLDLDGLIQLYKQLPKKKDGKVKRTEAYTTVFKVKYSKHRELYSAFITFLEDNFGV